MEVTVYGPLRGATGDKTVEVPFDGGTIADALAAFVEAYPRASDHLVAGDDAGGFDVHPSVRVLCDGERVDLDAACSADATLQLIPAAQGG